MTYIPDEIEKYDLICIGAGIMSTTLATLAKLLQPDMKIAIFERLEAPALESSAAWNNAGTGHSAFCELNYTDEKPDGSIDLSKAVKVCQQFELSRQLWSYLVEQNYIADPQSFIRTVPHHSWVRGRDNVDFLHKRFDAIKDHPYFKGMTFTTDHAEMARWFPLIMAHRPADEVLGATRMEAGVELNFGALTRHYVHILQAHFGLEVFYGQEVKDVDPDPEVDWTIEVIDEASGKAHYYDAGHVFIGAGGGALPLLQKVEIDEKDGYGGFPVGGQWLVCRDKSTISQHWAKVYSKADVGTPPMSVPHLDTRVIDGQQQLLFGPFAGFSTKFLKEGSWLDLPMSLNLDNLPSMWGAFWHNLDLTQYLVEQVLMSHEERMEDLRKFVINADSDQWELLDAGQRVQIIKKDEQDGGTLEFGTEVISNEDGSITALLGASPGASTAVSIMLDVLGKICPEVMADQTELLDRMVPSWGKSPAAQYEQLAALRAHSANVLGLEQ